MKNLQEDKKDERKEKLPSENFSASTSKLACIDDRVSSLPESFVSLRKGGVFSYALIGI